MDTPLQPFEPDHLIRLVYAQYPHRTDVLRALQLCSGGYWHDRKYIYFIGSRQAAIPKIVESLVIEDHQDGKIVVDVVADGRIAGIGFESRLEQ